MPDIIVSPIGNDGTGDGTPAAPYASLRAALTAAGPQGTVVAADGTYDYVEFAAGDAGASGHPTTLKAANKWGARIIPTAAHHGILIADGCDYAVIDGFRVSGGTLDGIKTNADHTTVENCWIHDNGGQGVLGAGAAYTTVDSCLIERNGTASGEHGIYIDSDNAVVRNNVVRNNYDFGIHCYLAAGVDNITVENNISYDNTSSAIIVQGKGAAGTISINNNVACQGASSTLAPISLRGCNGAVVANNIMIGGVGQMLDQRVNEADPAVDCSGTVFDSNWVYLNTESNNRHAVSNTDELLSNTGFETDGTGGQPFANWTKSEAGSSTVTSDTDNEDAGGGDKCCKLHVDSGSSCAVYQSGVMVVGGVYTLQFRAKASTVVGMLLNPPSVSCSLTTTYKTFRITFVATATYLYLQRATSSGTYDIYIDNVSLKRAYGPQVRSITQRLFMPRPGSPLIDGGNNTYAPAADFWGETPPTTIQIGAIPYTKALHPRTMLNDPFNAVKLNRRYVDNRDRLKLMK